MTPFSVRFTGLTLDPEDLRDKIIYGVIPEDWIRYRFSGAELYAQRIQRYLRRHCEARFAIIMGSYKGNEREVTIAFETEFDASMFVLGDGPTQCSQEAELNITP